MNWVWENRTWLFSGAGLTALACVVSLVRRFWLAKKETAPGHAPVMAKVEKNTMTNSPVAIGSNISQTINVANHLKEDVNASPKYMRNPTHQEIIKRIDDALPFDKTHTEQNHIGLHVRWAVELRGVESSKSSEPGVWAVSAKSVDTIGPSLVLFDVPGSIYPRLKIHPSNRPLEVEGIISTIMVGGLTIRLRDAKVFFPEGE